MLRFALETSTRLGSVAVGEADRLIAETVLSVRATHSETVLDEADRLLGRAGLDPTDLEAVVVGAGPGSFTGVRIAAALAKGLCYGRGIPLYAFSSLAAVAAVIPDRPLAVLFDARRDEVYAAGFAGPACEMLWGPEVLAVEAVLDRLAHAPGPGEGVGGWTFAGEGATKHAEAIASAGGTLAPPPLGVPRASALLWLAHVAGEGGRIADPGSWEPEYVRASGAERGVGRHV